MTPHTQISGDSRVADKTKGRKKWVKNMDLDFPPEVIVQFAAALYNSGFSAEAADVLRMGLERHFKNQVLEDNWKKLSDAHGGALSDTRWSMAEDPLFTDTIKWAGDE